LNRLSIRAGLARLKHRLRLAKQIAMQPKVASEELFIFRSLFKNQRHGVMVDVGAHWGGSLLPFATRGWEIHAFEPDPENRKRLIGNTRHFANVRVDQRAVADREGDELAFYTSMVSTGISTLRPFDESHRVTCRVSTVRLDTYCNEHNIRRIDFLKVDVEGFDLQVLRSHDWTLVRPEIVLCEFEDRKTLPLGHDVSVIAAFLSAARYEVVVSEWLPIVRYGADHQWRRAYRWGEADVPRESWGNLIAVSDKKQTDNLLAEFQRFARSRPL
jgi:FkbM family methyltransferase